jgi:DNA ligase-1
MGTPTKKRKLNNAQPSPSTTRNLDHFFGKRLREIPVQNVEKEHKGDSSNAPALTDEELARQLQAQWDQEEQAGQNSRDGSSPQIVDHQKELKEESRDGTTTKMLAEEDQVGIRPISVHKSQASFFGGKDKSTLSLQSGSTAEDVISSNIPFDESPLTFDPSKYVSDLQGHWGAEGGGASYALLTRCFVLVNSTQSRIKIVDTLVNLLRVLIEGDPSSLLPTVCSNISNLLLLPS